MAAARGGTSGETSPWQPRLSRPPALLRQVAEETQAFQQGGHTDRPRTTASRPLALAQLAAAGPREPQPRRCHHRRSRGSAPACCSSQAFPGCKTTDGGSGKAPEPVATMGPGSHPAVTSSPGRVRRPAPSGPESTPASRCPRREHVASPRGHGDGRVTRPPPTSPVSSRMGNGGPLTAFPGSRPGCGHIPPTAPVRLRKCWSGLTAIRDAEE